MENVFGSKIYKIKELFQDAAVEKVIFNLFKTVLEHLGIQKEESGSLTKQILEIAKNSNIIDYERQTHHILEKKGIIINYPKKLLGRTEIIFNQIKPFIVGKFILDYGCGDGKVGEMLAKEGFHVELADVYKHNHISKTGLKFWLINKDKIQSKDNSFDNTLVLTVLHHSDNPVATLKEAHRITKDKGIVIVIEDVYGVAGTELSETEKDKIKYFLKLNAEQQRRVNMFFDHFYNHIIFYKESPAEKINVPFNYNTVEGWNTVFKEWFKVERIIHLGLDQPISTIYHTLHVLRVKK